LNMKKDGCETGEIYVPGLDICVDKSIIPHIRKLNSMGHRTESSCSGTQTDHRGRDDNLFLYGAHIAFDTGDAIVSTGNKLEPKDKEYMKCVEKSLSDAGFKPQTKISLLSRKVGNKNRWGMISITSGGTPHSRKPVVQDRELLHSWNRLVKNMEECKKLIPEFGLPLPYELEYIW